MCIQTLQIYRSQNYFQDIWYIKYIFIVYNDIDRVFFHSIEILKLENDNNIALHSISFFCVGWLSVGNNIYLS